MFPDLILKAKENCVTMYHCALRAALFCGGVKPDRNPKSGDKNG